MVPAVILAAGRSSRMGRAKALLPVNERESFLRRLSTVLRSGGIDEVFVVGRPDDAALKKEADALAFTVRFVENPQADAGQLSSILAGLRAADRPGVRAILVHPVDVPLVTADTVAILLDRFNRTAAPIVRAVHDGVHGHPVLFARAVFGELRHADPAVGAKQVLRAHEGAILNVEAGDPGVVTDVDTPEDYERLFGRPL